MKFSSRLLIVCCTLAKWRGVAADNSVNATSTQVDTGKPVNIHTEPPFLMLKANPLLSLREQNLSTESKISSPGLLRKSKISSPGLLREPKISSQVLLIFLNVVSIHNNLGTGITNKIVKDVKFKNEPLISMISDAVDENLHLNEKIRNTLSKIPDLSGKRHHANKLPSENNVNTHNKLFFMTSSNDLMSPKFDPSIILNEINNEDRKNWLKNVKKDTVIWEKDKVNLSNTSFNDFPESHENAKSEQKLLDHVKYSHNVGVGSARNTRSVDNDEHFTDNQYRSMNVTVYGRARKPRRRTRNKKEWLEIHKEGLEGYESNIPSQPSNNSTQSKNNVAKKPKNDFRGGPRRNQGRRRRYKYNKNLRRTHESGDSTVLENHTFNQLSSNTAGSYNPLIQNFKTDTSRKNKFQNYHNTGTNGPNVNNTYDNGTIHQYSDHNNDSTPINGDLDTILNIKGSAVNSGNTDHPHNHNTSVGALRRITRRRRGRRLKEDLSLYIDQDQVQRLSGYPMEIYVIQDGRVLPYVLDPNFNNRLPVIPPEVSSFNFTWSGGGRRRYRYQVDNLASLNPSIMEHPTLSIPPRGRISRRHTGFEIKLPCRDNATGTTTFTVRLKIRTRHQHLAGTPIRVRLRKRCHPIDPHGGAAQCPVGLMGPNCTEALCFPHCLHGGVCRAPGRCVCPAGYHGRYCEGGICSDRCLNGGKCVQKDRCACARGYYGNTCQFSKCVVPCVNGGVCRGDNKCRCKPGFGGSHCEVTQQTSAVRLQRCRERCVHGHCHDVTGVCRCDDSHSGRWCRRRARGRRRRIWV